MAKWRFTVHGGDFRKGAAFFKEGFFSSTFYLPGLFLWNERDVKDLERVDLVTDDMVQDGPSRAGGAAVGFLLAGPIGAALGVLAGGKQKHETTFVVQFADGKAFVASGDLATFQRLKSVSLKASSQRTTAIPKLNQEKPTSSPRDEKACPFCGEQILAVAIKCKHCGEMLEKR